ncbi:type I phosphomannose isomerase catalytic subunit [uncultured Tyzzerella sp.]|uniref:type I phosphomannose isomerase catalytic subunit n=1 Tax=uncultured Tyzzerella sp. TaxID=2321398 RepID=UPI0029435C7B|nr:type I phosphomannose isomerase catalytic subunit [uncultured Tyzzerella sp.]
MFKLQPSFKDYLWGGTKLRTVYGKECSLDKVAESWELSTHKDGLTIIDSGSYKGETLLSYVEKYGKEVLGSKCSLDKDIPILIKFIDAKDALSIQVHPDNEYALKNENDFGKTEMWYIIDAEPNAKLIYGFKEDITKEQFKQAIENNSLEELVNEVDVKAGDVFFITPGTMHAIGKGIVIAEIQQRSNVTYRIYDFGRVGADGKTRELHIDKALDVTKLEAAKNAKKEYTLNKFDGYEKGNLSSCEYFNVDLLNIETNATLNCDNTTFNCITILDGSCTISGKETLDVKKGESIFIPASYGEYNITGKCKVILSTL